MFSSGRRTSVRANKDYEPRWNRWDPARPGYAASHIWAAGIHSREADVAKARTHRAIEPPPKGSVCRVVTFPPDAVYAGKVGASEVAAFFAAQRRFRASRMAFLPAALSLRFGLAFGAALWAMAFFPLTGGCFAACELTAAFTRAKAAIAS